MKKLSFLLLSLLAVTMLTSCGNDDPVNKQTAVIVINNRAIQGDQVVFSQGNASVELDYTNMNIAFSFNYKDADGQSHNISTSVMKMRSSNRTTYQFNSDDNSLTGSIDLGTGMMYFTYAPSSDTRVYSSSHLLYAYTTTTITNLDNGNHGSHQQSSYLFVIDARGEKCVMQINNFISNLNGVVDAAEVYYEGLTITPTLTGYTITADKAESNAKGFYTITDLNITIDDQCNVINGSFMSNGLKHEISGGLFNYTTPI